MRGGRASPLLQAGMYLNYTSELTRCRLQFDGQAELSYEVTLSNSEFIDYLIDVIMNFKRSKTTDFPRSFYRKLLRFE